MRLTSFAHLRDDELMVLADAGNESELVRARRHVQRCAACQRRIDERRRAIERLDALTGCEETAPSPGADAARRQLQARLRQASRERSAGDRRAAGWAVAAAMLCATATLGWLAAEREAATVAEVPVAAVVLRPLPALTPGVALTTEAGAVCGPRAPQRQVMPAGVSLEIFDRYGADITRASEYELDYLITPELGGAADPRNLWPQSFDRTVWNAYVKDELEIHLHKMVCSGRLPLADAQRQIAIDWIEAYQQHFATSQPRRDYRISPLGAGDEEMLRAEREELESAPLLMAPARYLIQILSIGKGLNGWVSRRSAASDTSRRWKPALGQRA